MGGRNVRRGKGFLKEVKNRLLCGRSGKEKMLNRVKEEGSEREKCNKGGWFGVR